MFIKSELGAVCRCLLHLAAQQTFKIQGFTTSLTLGVTHHLAKPPSGEHTDNQLTVELIIDQEEKLNICCFQPFTLSQIEYSDAI